jgi:hypothetical protein
MSLKVSQLFMASPQEFSQDVRIRFEVSVLPPRGVPRDFTVSK